MSKFILLLFVVLAAPFALSQSSEPEIFRQSITRLFPRENPLELQKGDLLVLDLDNTVFREVQLLGTDDWYSYAEHQLREQGLTRLEAEDRLHGLNSKIKNATRMRLMEEEMPAWIRLLQSRAVNVIGLTARSPEFADLTLRQLKEFGIRFDAPVFKEDHLKSMPALYRGGIAFVRGESKGRILRAMLEQSGYRPNRVIAIDDRIHHIHSFHEALTELKIGGSVIHYLKALEEPPFNPEVAEMQRKFFEVTGQLLSDERALRECELQLSEADQKTFRNPDHYDQ